MGTECIVRAFRSGSELLLAAKTWLYADEVGNNTIISIAKRAGSPHSLLRPPFLFLTAAIDDRVVGCAAFANPDGLVLSEMSDQCCRSVLMNVAERGLQPNRLYVPHVIADIARNELSRHLTKDLVEKSMWHSFGIEQPIEFKESMSGRLRLASDEDIDEVRFIGDQYNDEKPSIVDVASYFELKAKLSDLHLLCRSEDDEILTVVATSGETEHVSRIAAVFTPKKHRRSGYARQAVAAATNAKLDDGFRLVTLFVEKKDVEAISLYKRLGFRALGNFVEFACEFVA